MDKNIVNTYITKLKDTDKISFENFLNVSNKHLPNKLFRFRPLNDDVKNGNKKSNADLEIDNLKNNLLYLSSPDFFNDPYDSKFLLDRYEFIKLFLKSNKCRDLYGINNENLINQTKTEKFFDNLMSFCSIYIELLQNLSSSLRICCFSENDYTNVLMWSHYASNHTGYCVEYENSFLLESSYYKECMCPVCYSKEIFDISKYFVKFIESIQEKSIDKNIDFIYFSTIFKSIEWEYEREWRLITDNSNPNLINNNLLKIQQPKKIYLGTNIKKDYKEQIIDICKEKYIEIYQMYLYRNKYSLTAKPICYKP